MMLEQIADEFKPLLKAKNLTLTVSAEQEILIKGDALRLERAFDNLIRNAVNYCYENTEIKCRRDRERDNDFLQKCRSCHSRPSSGPNL